MFKKILLLLPVLIILLTSNSEAISRNHINIIIRTPSNTFTFAEDVLINNAGRTFVPVRNIFEALGASVHWSTQGIITISKNSYNIRLQHNSPIGIINGTQTKLDTPIKQVNGRTLIPLRFISEAIGASVNWNRKTMTIKIVTQSDMHSSQELPPQAKNSPKIISLQGERLTIGMSELICLKTISLPMIHPPKVR